MGCRDRLHAPPRRDLFCSSAARSMPTKNLHSLGQKVVLHL